ncbi:MAG: tetratricopeptide repeat protein [Lentisphaeria bacterium]|nr:tetratricopeptide repeat protein [Lentisphaeria bacterium]
MKISTRLTLICALVGSMSLPGAEIASDTVAETPAAPVAAPKLSAAEEARVRAIENFMSATKSQNRDERFTLLIEVLKDDPAAIPPRNYIRGMVDTRADARKIADKLLEISAANPKQLGLAALTFQMCYAANMLPADYLGNISIVLDEISEPAKLPDEVKGEYYNVIGAYSSALKQARNYREGTKYFAAELDRETSAYRAMLLRFAVDFEHFFSRFGSRESRWFGLVGSDRDAAKERFEQLFTELETLEQGATAEEADRNIDFYLSVGKPEAALRVAEKIAKEKPLPANETRLAYTAIAAQKFDLVPPIVAKLSKIDGWKGVSQLISINSLLAQKKYDQAQKEIRQLKVPIARDEFMLKLFEAKKDYKAMRDELNAMEKRLSPGVEIDLANAVRQLVVAEKLKDVELLNRIWKLMVDTEQIESSEAANSVGYVAAELNVRLDDAEKLIREALKGEPDNYAYLDSMAWVLYRQGKYAEAEKYIDLALRASEQELARGVIYEHKGDILMKLGRKSEALAAYREALDYAADDDFDPARVEAKIKNLE